VQKNPVAIESRLEGLRILVVDDEPDTGELLRRLLNHAGAQASVAASASEAIATVAAMRPHLLVSDISMPEEDGFALMRRLRKGGLSIPAVAVTANVGYDDRDNALAAGFDAYLPKPINTSELLRVLASLARSRGARAEA
jgi:CheY-like chemotaxis protein